MTVYIISPKPIDVDRINNYLGSSKVTGLGGNLRLSAITITTNAPFTIAERDMMFAQLDKLMPFGYDVTVE